MTQIKFDEEANIVRSVDCPACGEAGDKRRYLEVRGQTGVLDLFKCEACGSLFYDPFPRPDYTSHSGGIALRDYVEMGASIDGPAQNIFRVMRQGHKGRMIDIGCGFGFPLHVAKTLAGWDVRGYEPSQYGDAGREQLGVDIRNEFAPNNPDPTDLFDIVHCSEVIEHVFDAKQFVDLLASYLSPSGVLVLTTPNPERITKDAPPHITLPLLSPGAHTILFSDEALSRLFRKAGLVHVHVEKSPMSTLYYASREPIRFQPMDGWDRGFSTYLIAAAERAPMGSPLQVGLRYRAFRSASDRGWFDLAEKLYDPQMAAVDPALGDITNISQFAARWPFCIAASTYYMGMYHLIHRPDNTYAARLFDAAYRLCRKKIDLTPAASVAEADLIWRAVYHKALAESRAGQNRSASVTLDLLRHPEDLSPPVPFDLQAQVSSLRTTLN